jgi:hypothetical protein
MSKASEPDKQNGTSFADSIRASSPNRLRQQAGQKTAPDQSQHIYLPLATREPSTEDMTAQPTSPLKSAEQAFGGRPERFASGYPKRHINARYERKGDWNTIAVRAIA